MEASLAVADLDDSMVGDGDTMAMATRRGNARDRRGSGSITRIVKTIEWRDNGLGDLR